MNSFDEQIRLATFKWLETQTLLYDGVLPLDLLREGFLFNGERIYLVSPQGIFKPKKMELPLSITTSPNSPYDDGVGKGDYLNYKYRGDNIHHRDNEGLRKCMKKSIPLVYFFGLVPGQYLPIWPVYIINDDPFSLTFSVAVDEIKTQTYKERHFKEEEFKKAYLTGVAKTRLHQKAFREKVLYAYKSQCTLCKLRHKELLDAAHILPDREDEGQPIVSNGLSLCKLHHAAFDKYFIGITPDYVVEVRKDILDEIDGPILQHGLKEINGQKLYLPLKDIDKPNREFLDCIYQKFRKVS